MVSERDELRHVAGEGLNWSESYYFNFFDSLNNVAGFFRIGLEENKKQSNLWCFLMKDGKTIYNRFKLDLAYSEKGLEDLTVGDLRFKMLDPFKKFCIYFKDRHLTIDLTWQGYTEVFDMYEGMKELPAVLAAGHYDQMGEATGRISMEGEEVNIFGYGFRDHSWGLRDWEGVKNWKAFIGQFKKDFAFMIAEFNEATGKTSYIGFLFDDGRNIKIVKADIKIDFYADHLTPKEATIEIENIEGGRTKITAQSILVCPMPYDFNLLQEGYARFQMGERIGYGLFELNRRLYGKHSTW
jgi:hypothetical protein